MKKTAEPTSADVQKPVEEKTQKFVRIAARRMNQAIKAIDLLGNCSEHAAYDYTDEQVGKMFARLEKAVAETRTRFDQANKNGRDEFTF